MTASVVQLSTRTPASSWSILVLLVAMALPQVTLALGGGDGGDGDANDAFPDAPTIDVTINNQTVSIDEDSVTDVTLTDGTLSGKWNGTTVTFNQTTGDWEGYESQGPGGWESVGGGLPPPSGGSGYIVSQACVNSSQVDVTFRAPTCWTLSWASNWCYYPNSSLYDNPWAFRASFQNGETKTIRMTAGSNYPSALWSASFWTGDYQVSDTKPFSYTVRNDCTPPPPPTATLAVRNLTTDSNWTSENIAMDPGDQLALSWSSNNASSCSGDSFFSTGGAVSGWTGTVNETGAGESRTYRVTCYGSNGGYAWDELTVNVWDYPLPSAELLVRNVTTGGGWTDTLTIDPGDDVALSWSSSHTNVCHGSYFSTFDELSGVTTQVTEPVPGTTGEYSVICEGDGGLAGDLVDVTVTSYPPPTVSLEVRNDTNSTDWTGSDITIDPIDDISLQWASTNATACLGTNFSTGSGSPENDSQSTVTEPTAGNTINYVVTCTGLGGSADDTLSVTTTQGSEVTLTADPTFVRIGDESSLSWDTGTNDPATCTLSGPGVSYSALPSISGSTDPNPTIGGESTFTLTCPGDSDTATVQILPTLQET